MLIKIIQSCLLGTLLILVGCATNPRQHLPPEISSHAKTGVLGAASGAAVGSLVGVGAPVGAMIGGMAGLLIGDQEHKKDTPMSILTRNLTNTGVTIVKNGDEFLLVMPAKNVFHGHTPRLRESALDELNLLIVYLRTFNKTDVKVAAFTDNVGSPARNVALSRERARRIVAYLSDKGVDARLLYGIGYGPAHPIASNATRMGRRLNRRLEISFRRIG